MALDAAADDALPEASVEGEGLALSFESKFDAAGVPEPAAALLLVVGLLTLPRGRRRR